jgi:autotransporter-associated beta strand protein
VFANTGSSTVTVTAGPIAPDSWTFNANSQAYTVSGQALNFGGSGLVNNANLGQSISVANNIGGAGSVNQAGSSLLTLSGSNNYTGGTTISAGALRLGNASALGNTSGNTVAISAAQSPDKALTTVSVDVKWPCGFSLAAVFEGAFSNNSSSFAGKGIARYQW